jgi:hypothetical protein
MFLILSNIKCFTKVIGCPHVLKKFIAEGNFIVP